MLKYVKPFILIALLAVLAMAAEVTFDLLQPRLMTVIVDDGVLGVSTGGTGDLGVILRCGAMMILMAFTGGIFGVLNNAFVNMASLRSGNMIRKDCFDRIMSFSVEDTQSIGTGTLITRMTNDITRIQALISHFTRGLVRTGMLTFGSLYFLLVLNRTFALLVLSAVPFIVIILSVCLRKVMPVLSAAQERLDDLNGLMQEDLGAVRIIKACVREEYEKKRFELTGRDLVMIQLKSLIIFAWMNPLINLVMNAATVLILFSGSRQFARGEVTPGVIMAAVTYTTQLLNGIMSLNNLFQNISRGMTSWNRVGELLRMNPGMKDGDIELSMKGGASLEMRHVSFSYPGSNREVLHDISFRIEKGSSVAVLGSTGSGKTTLASLIPRLYDATGGTVLVDGTDVRDIKLSSLRNRVSIAMQRPDIFSETVRENILWGKPDASDDEVRSSSDIARADGFISEMKDGYDSVLDERGTNLSGGQKQRIALARAVIRDAGLLILDDATSALDLGTEAEFYEKLDKNRSGITKLIIAQRIASTAGCDSIIVMDGGKICDMGTHRELMERCSVYRDIYHSQLGEEADA